jgi:hypothetical protein
MRGQVIGRLKHSPALFGKHEVEKKQRRMRVRRVFGDADGIVVTVIRSSAFTTCRTSISPLIDNLESYKHAIASSFLTLA